MLRKLFDRVWCGLNADGLIDFQTGMNFVVQQSDCATVLSVYGHVCELLYHVTGPSLILIPFASSF
jgi:hypothetical protein